MRKKNKGGRPKGEPTKVIRVPKAIVEDVNFIKKLYLKGRRVTLSIGSENGI